LLVLFLWTTKFTDCQTNQQAWRGVELRHRLDCAGDQPADMRPGEAGLPLYLIVFAAFLLCQVVHLAAKCSGSKQI
jgi:hypothetical protein